MSIRVASIGFISLIIAAIVLVFAPWDRILTSEMRPIHLIDSLGLETPETTDSLKAKARKFSQERQYKIRYGMNRGGTSLYIQLEKEECLLIMQQLDERLFVIELYEVTQKNKTCADFNIAKELKRRFSRP